MEAAAPKLPVFVPIFTELFVRGVPFPLVRLYGAVAAYHAMSYVPTCVEIATAANYNTSGDALRVRKMLRKLVKLELITRVRHSPSCSRFVPNGPRLASVLGMAPANDNGIAYEPVRLCRECGTQGVCKACGAANTKAFTLNAPKP
jgi:hypothetical protein